MKTIKLLLMIINGLIMLTINYPLIITSSFLLPEIGFRAGDFMEDAAQKMKGTAQCHWKDVFNYTLFNTAYLLVGAFIFVGIRQLIN